MPFLNGRSIYNRKIAQEHKNKKMKSENNKPELAERVIAKTGVTGKTPNGFLKRRNKSIGWLTIIQV
jgi:hypothetical protein